MKKPKKLNPTLISQYEELRGLIQEAQDKLRALRDKIETKMGDSEFGDFGDPERLVRRFKVHRKEHVVKESWYFQIQIVKKGDSK